MSATSQKLLEEIQTIENNIKLIESIGGDPSALRVKLRETQQLFAAANSTLNEGRSVLKG